MITHPYKFYVGEHIFWKLIPPIKNSNNEQLSGLQLPLSLYSHVSGFLRFLVLSLSVVTEVSDHIFTRLCQEWTIVSME